MTFLQTFVVCCESCGTRIAVMSSSHRRANEELDTLGWFVEAHYTNRFHNTPSTITKVIHLCPVCSVYKDAFTNKPNYRAG